jgi:hypothetical protein
MLSQPSHRLCDAPDRAGGRRQDRRLWRRLRSPGRHSGSPHCPGPRRGYWLRLGFEYVVPLRRWERSRSWARPGPATVPGGPAPEVDPRCFHNDDIMAGLIGARFDCRDDFSEQQTGRIWLNDAYDSENRFPRNCFCIDYMSNWLSVNWPLGARLWHVQAFLRTKGLRSESVGRRL